jgi:hypothetical protein
MHQNHLDSILVGYQVDSSQFLDSSLCAKSQGYPRNSQVRWQQDLARLQRLCKSV